MSKIKTPNSTLNMSRAEFIKKCSLLNISEKKAADMYSKAIGSINQANVGAKPGKVSPPKVLPAPKLDYTKDTQKTNSSIEAVKKAAFNIGFKDGLNFISNGS